MKKLLLFLGRSFLLKLPAMLNSLAIKCFCLLVVITGINQTVTAQTASFTFTTDGCVPATADFTDQSTDATSWDWDLGNANISAQQNPSANYSLAGVYSVTLTINGGVSSITQTVNVYPRPNPTTPMRKEGCAPFSTSLSTVAEPVVVEPFTIQGGDGVDDSDVGGITGGEAVDFEWNFFGKLPTVNTTTSTLSLTDIPVGSYNLLLTVTDEHGCDRSVFLLNAIIVHPVPEAEFTFAKQNECGLGNVDFTGSATISSGSVTGYEWNFGDPASGVFNTSTLQTRHTITPAPEPIRLL